MSIVTALNDSFKDGQVAYIIGQDETPIDLTEFVRTGSSLLDLAISNRKNGGVPCGRIVEINGLEGSGKSLICAHILANVQKEGGVAVLLDTENAVNQEFFESIGLDMSKLVYGRPETVEDIFTMIESIIVKVREKNGSSDKKIVIVVDSIAASPTKQELEGTYDKEGYATGKAIIISKAMRKITSSIGTQKIVLIFTNQLRHKMNAPAFADPYTTSGGKAIPFHASVRIRLNIIAKVKSKESGTVIGVTVKAAVVKNRVGPPYRSAEFTIFFDRGIDDIESLLKFSKAHGIVKSAGAYVTYEDSENGVHRTTSKEWEGFLRDNPKIYDELCHRIATEYVMLYASKHLSPSDVINVNEDDDSESISN